MPLPPEYADVAAEIAATVRAEMARQNKTAADLAGLLKVTAPTVRQRLSGDVAFDVVELAMIARWLGVDPTVFSIKPQAATA